MILTLTGHIDQSPPSSHVDTTQAEAAPVNGKSENSATPQDPIGIKPQPTFDEDPAEHLPQQNTEPVLGHYQETVYTNQ